MDQDQGQEHPNSPTNGSDIRNSSNNTTEPAVRSRWTPKPEQILILESIFNSGMVNPPKDETVRIRKLLEKFGSVGDANVFYWFQNRRSRSRRRQRQMQAQLNNVGGAIQYESTNSTTATSTTPAAAMAGFGGGSAYSFVSSASNTSYLMGGCSSSNSCGVLGDDHGHVENNFFQFSGQMGIPEIEQNSAVTSVLYPPDSSNMHFQLPGILYKYKHKVMCMGDLMITTFCLRYLIKFSFFPFLFSYKLL